MAEHADGSIIVDTEIDSSGFKSGSAELKSAIKSLSNKISGLGPTFQKAMSGNTKAMGTFEAKASALKSKISELESKLARLGNARLPTADFKYFSIELEKAQRHLAQLEAREAKMGAMGVKERAAAYKSLQYDIALAKEKIMDLQATMAGMQQNGTAFQMGSATPQYQQMEAALAAANVELTEMDAAAASVVSTSSALPGVGMRILAAFLKAGAVIKNGVVTGLHMAAKAAKTLLTYTLKAVTGMTKLGKASQKTGRRMHGSFGMMMRSMLFFTVFSAVLKGFKEGIDAMAMSSSSFNKTMSDLKTSLAQLRNSLITAFAPILSVIVPILSTLISKLATAISYIGQFFAALTGAKTFTKAITKQQDYAASLKKTAGAAKEAKRQLAGFDELNVLSDSSGGGGGGASEDPGVTFEEVPIDSGIAGFVAKIKEAFANGEYAEIGRIIGEKLNEVFQSIHDYISWDRVGEPIKKYIHIFCEIFNSLVDTIDWTLIGDTFAEGIDTISNTLYYLLTGIDWEKLGSALGEGLNGLVRGVNWSRFGETIGAYIMARLNVIYGAITTFDWKSAGNALGTSIMGLWNSVDWAKLGSTLSTAVKGLLNFISEAIKTIEWYQIGKDVADFIANIDWSGVVTALADGIGAALGGLVSLLWGLIEDAWKTVVQWWNETAYEDGVFTMEGLLQGIGDGLKNIGKWIVDNIFKPFINGFCDAFKINSPSKVMQEHGVYLIDGLLLGITDTWREITSFFKDAISSIGSTLSNGWNSIKSAASTANKNISSALQSAWNTIKSNVSNSLNGIKSTASNTWNTIKSTVSSASSNIQSRISSCWNSAASSIRSKLSSISSNMRSTFTNLASNAYTWGSHIVQNLVRGITNFAHTVTNAVSNLASRIRSYIGFSEPEKGPLSNFHTYMPDMLDLMEKGILDNEYKAVGAVSHVAKAISDEVQNGDYGTVGISTEAQVSSSLTGFGDTIANSFAELMNRLQAIANGVSFASPEVVKGVMPYSVSAAQDGSRGGTAYNEDISSVVIQSVNNATVAIVKAIEEYSQTNVNIDSQSLTDSIISEINRRTKMAGKSPLLT